MEKNRWKCQRYHTARSVSATTMIVSEKVNKFRCNLVSRENIVHAQRDCQNVFVLSALVSSIIYLFYVYLDFFKRFISNRFIQSSETLLSYTVSVFFFLFCTCLHGFKCAKSKDSQLSLHVALLEPRKSVGFSQIHIDSCCSFNIR